MGKFLKKKSKREKNLLSQFYPIKKQKKKHQMKINRIKRS